MWRLDFVPFLQRVWVVLFQYAINLVRLTLQTPPLSPALSFLWLLSVRRYKLETWADHGIWGSHSLLLLYGFMFLLCGCGCPGPPSSGLQVRKTAFFYWRLSLLIPSDYGCQNGKLNLVLLTLEQRGLNCIGPLSTFISH